MKNKCKIKMPEFTYEVLNKKDASKIENPDRNYKVTSNDGIISYYTKQMFTNHFELIK